MGLHSGLEWKPEGESDREWYAGSDTQDCNLTGKLWEDADSNNTSAKVIKYHRKSTV